MPSDTRDRMIDAAIEALRTKGVAGMSFTEVLDASGAARGAIYHHFPGGKAELVAEAATRNGRDVCAHLAELPATDPRAVVEDFLTAVRPVVGASAEGGGCAVAAVTVDAESSSLRTIAATIFESWTRALTKRLTVAGVAGDSATDLATTLIALLQGAHVLCRAEGTLAPFDRAARTATDLMRAKYPGDPSTPSTSE